MAWGTGVAIAAWLIGVVTLGQNWYGSQRGPGVWVDGVSLTQWSGCWAALALLAMSTAPHVRGWVVRLASLLPLVSWIVWHLRGSALGPIPVLIYVGPTALIWCASLGAGTWAHRRLARYVKRTGA